MPHAAPLAGRLGSRDGHGLGIELNIGTAVDLGLSASPTKACHGLQEGWTEWTHANKSRKPRPEHILTSIDVGDMDSECGIADGRDGGVVTIWNQRCSHHQVDWGQGSQQWKRRHSQKSHIADSGSKAVATECLGCEVDAKDCLRNGIIRLL